MNKHTGAYHVVDFPPERRFMANMLSLTWVNKHSMYGLLEVDVTGAKQFIAEHKARTGEVLSFTAYLLLCLARAVDENRPCRPAGKAATSSSCLTTYTSGLWSNRRSERTTRSARRPDRPAAPYLL
jgi:hypothetical protein